jgi:hypothetical protein
MEMFTDPVFWIAVLLVAASEIGHLARPPA